MHIHLDLAGGLSGDMFIGALLDCFPDLSESLSEQLVRAGFRDLVKLEMEPASDGILTGTRFKVTAGEDAPATHHRHYREIRQIIGDSRLDEPIRDKALDIFRIIAAAEAKVHGQDIGSVAFHEIGAWDSIADVICAACLITAVDAGGWSVSSLPLGRGQVKTAHGLMPVPAPATALILEGFEFHDDGIEGERITPTGAAILKHLAPVQAARPVAGRLRRSGYGFGSKRFPGISNVTRALVFDTPPASAWDTDQVLQLEFEIDDQTPEELADALNRLRATDGVLDVTQTVAFGKKGRQVASVRILARPGDEDCVTRACFDETTTLGIRRQLVTRSVLSRSEQTITREDRSFRVKLARRPGSTTAKTEMDDLAGIDGDHATRRAIRREVEDNVRKEPGSSDE